MNKLKFETPDLTAENVKKIGELFPGVVAEGKVNFDLLRSMLGDDVFKDEAYEFTWVGKRDAIAEAGRPIRKTLRPCVEESKNWDTTENLYIEGDNLEVLKLLQESYLGKVKMIYIDPPYNTGNDFIYDDTFMMDKGEYDEAIEQYDENGLKNFRPNSTTNPRYHSDWCTMIYPRLVLARNLLQENGVIFISIDDNEVAQLRKICDEVFGEENFLTQISVLNNPKGRSQDKFVATCHEFIFAYSKCTLEKGALSIDKSNEQIRSEYPLSDEIGAYRELELRNTHRSFGRHNRPNLYYPFHVDKSGQVSFVPTIDSEEVYPNWDDGFEGCWTWGRDKALNEMTLLVARQVKGSWKIYRKSYAMSDGEIAKKQVKSIWFEKKFHTEKGQAIFNNLFDAKEKYFQSPKSVELLRECILMSQSNNNDIILDFFSGSATTAHAVMQINAEDGGNRKFILVQLPEDCAEGTEAAKAGYKTICEIGKERIRRAGEKIVGSGKWVVDSEEEKKKYGCKELSRADCMAEGNGSGPADLCSGQKTAERGTLLPVRSDEEGIGIDPLEHRGGSSEELNEGVCSVSGNSKRVESGAGNTAAALRESGIPCRYGHFGSDASTPRSGENVGCPHKNTNHCPLTTTHSPLDIGFRVLKVDETNVNDVYYAPSEYTQQKLLGLVDNIKPDRTDMDLLFACLLDWGLPLSMTHTHEKIDGFTVHTYNNGDLIACFDKDISENVIRTIANRKPLRAVFRDNGFSNSPEKINVFEIFKLLAPRTSVKVI